MWWCWYILFFSIMTGGYDKEEKAARAYDLAALKYWGPTTHTNFPVNIYNPFTTNLMALFWFSFAACVVKAISYIQVYIHTYIVWCLCPHYYEWELALISHTDIVSIIYTYKTCLHIDIHYVWDISCFTAHILYIFSDGEVCGFLQTSTYKDELEEMKNMTRQEYVASLRRYLSIYSLVHYNSKHCWHKTEK